MKKAVQKIEKKKTKNKKNPKNNLLVVKSRLPKFGVPENKQNSEH